MRLLIGLQSATYRFTGRIDIRENVVDSVKQVFDGAGNIPVNSNGTKLRKKLISLSVTFMLKAEAF